MWEWIKNQIYQRYLALDNCGNAWIFCGYADESISSRCFRRNDIRIVRVCEIVVDAVHYPFQGPDHCKNAYIRDVQGKQLPPHFYAKAIEMGIKIDRSRIGDLVEVSK